MNGIASLGGLNLSSRLHSQTDARLCFCFFSDAPCVGTELAE